MPEPINPKLDEYGVEVDEHGVADVVWDNLGGGWRIECLCGWTSEPHHRMESAGMYFDEHLGLTRRPHA